jgi:hypothetical protein
MAAVKNEGNGRSFHDSTVRRIFVALRFQTTCGGSAIHTAVAFLLAMTGPRNLRETSRRRAETGVLQTRRSIKEK